MENRLKMNEFELAHGCELGGKCAAERGEDGDFLFIGEVELARAESVDTGVLRGVGFALFGNGARWNGGRWRGWLRFVRRKVTGS